MISSIRHGGRGRNRLPYAVLILAIATGVVGSAGSAPTDDPGTPATEARAQCGHWAVYRICQMLGVPVTLNRLMNDMPPREGGHSLRMLADVLQGVGVDSEGREETLDRLAASPLPVIAHLAPDHYVVVARTEGERLVIYDDQGQRRIWTSKEFEKRWTRRTLRVRRAGRAASASGVRPPHADFDTLLLDKGEIPVTGRPFPFEFEFSNTGGSPLVIQSVTADCKCVSFTKPERPIPPGGRGRVTLAYNVQPDGGSFSHSAVVATNDPSVPMVKLTVAGNGDYRVRVVPGRIDFGTIVAGTTQPKFFRISSTADDPLQVNQIAASISCGQLSYRVLSPDDLRGRIKVVGRPAQTFVNNQVVQVELAADTRAAGPYEGSLQVRTNIRGFETLTVPLTVRVVHPVLAAPETLYLGEPAPGEWLEQRVTLESYDGRPFTIQSVACGRSGLLCSFDKDPRKESHVSIRGKAREWRDADVVINILMSNDSEPVTLRLPVYMRPQNTPNEPPADK